MPPVIWNAGRVMPNRSNMSLPSRLKITISAKVYSRAFAATRRLMSGVSAGGQAEKDRGIGNRVHYGKETHEYR